MICHQGLGEGFSIFGTDIGSQGNLTSQGASIWGDTLPRAAATEQYTQMLQQGPPVRPSMDSNSSSGGLFGGKGLAGMPDNGSMLVYSCSDCARLAVCSCYAMHGDERFPQRASSGACEGQACSNGYYTVPRGFLLMMGVACRARGVPPAASWGHAPGCSVCQPGLCQPRAAPAAAELMGRFAHGPPRVDLVIHPIRKVSHTLGLHLLTARACTDFTCHMQSSTLLQAAASAYVLGLSLSHAL